MSDEALINLIIDELEKSQKVKIWDSQNQVPQETVNLIKAAIGKVKDGAIKEHILTTFGPK